MKLCLVVSFSYVDDVPVLEPHPVFTNRDEAFSYASHLLASYDVYEIEAGKPPQLLGASFPGSES